MDCFPRSYEMTIKDAWRWGVGSLIIDEGGGENKLGRNKSTVEISMVQLYKHEFVIRCEGTTNESEKLEREFLLLFPPPLPPSLSLSLPLSSLFPEFYKC